MLSSNADVPRSLPSARRAFTVATGPLAHTPPAPSSSSAFSLPPPLLFVTRSWSAESGCGGYAESIEGRPVWVAM
eukprot:1856531-Pleurochrysis_carterae.AAC.2